MNKNNGGFRIPITPENAKNVSSTSTLEDFAETHICKLRGVLRSRVLRVRVLSFSVTSSPRMLALIEGNKI